MVEMRLANVDNASLSLRVGTEEDSAGSSRPCFAEISPTLRDIVKIIFAGLCYISWALLVNGNGRRVW